ncbi:MAG: hypothetical protein M3169_00045 [Candidatus Eremiobacteraeota bacterium]|nr:hypothetical protein [Candidatus Eremiobacteraeota bacterium]
MDLQNLVQQFTGGANAAPLEQAADQHLDSMAPDDIAQHVQTAAANANASGQPGVAQELESMLEHGQADPAALKDAAVAYIKGNPQVLTHFAPSFAQGILNRVI